jgi:hypothetical protein
MKKIDKSLGIAMGNLDKLNTAQINYLHSALK